MDHVINIHLYVMAILIVLVAMMSLIALLIYFIAPQMDNAIHSPSTVMEFRIVTMDMMKELIVQDVQIMECLSVLLMENVFPCLRNVMVLLIVKMDTMN